MKRAATLSPLPLWLDRTATTPLWRQLAVSLRFAMASGRLRPGARLPSTRALARRLGVSRTTVMAAYDDVAARGLLRARTGAGSYVAGRARAGLAGRAWFRDDSGNRLTIAALG